MTTTIDIIGTWAEPVGPDTYQFYAKDDTGTIYVGGTILAATATEAHAAAAIYPGPWV